MQTDDLKRRRQKRWQLVQYLRVKDKETGEIIGHLVDISTEGVMLISDKAINPESSYEFSMEIPHPEKQITSLHFAVKSLWSKPDINPYFHNSGFCLVDPQPETVSNIEALINELKQLNENTETAEIK